MRDYKIEMIVGAVIGAPLVYGMIWAASLFCVAIGGAPEVCGL